MAAELITVITRVLTQGTKANVLDFKGLFL